MHATQVPRPLLISRNGRDHTKRFRQLVEALTVLKPNDLPPNLASFDQELGRSGLVMFSVRRELASSR